MTCTSAARRARTMRLLVALAQCACSSRSHNALARRARTTRSLVALPTPRHARLCTTAAMCKAHTVGSSTACPARPHSPAPLARTLDGSATGGSTSPPRRPVARHRRLGATPSPQKRLCTTAAMCKAQTVGSSTACPARPHSPAPLARTLDGSATGGSTSPPRRPVARHRRLGATPSPQRWLQPIPLVVRKLDATAAAQKVGDGGTFLTKNQYFS